jgi:hypothetical protein
MLTYGAIKAIPQQMSSPTLIRLLEPYGNFSPMGVLWASVGSARAYEIIVGCAELLGGTLLFFRRTTLLGALVCLVDTVQIFLLNMTYDVPVKLFSFHLILMSVTLIAPDAKRLVNVLLLDRATAPSRPSAVPASRRRRWTTFAAQAVVGAYLLTMNFVGSYQAWNAFGGGMALPPLYGIWDVEEMSIDGVTRAPLTTDWDRWKWVVIQDAMSIRFQRQDDTVVRYRSAVDLKARTVVLLPMNGTPPVGQFAFVQPAPDRLNLDGTMNGHRVRLGLHLVNHRQKFYLLGPAFHWIQEYPQNR